MMNSLLLAQDSGGGGIAGLIFLVLYLGIIVLMIASMWKVFDKAGEPGWAAIIPIYNIVVLLKVAGKPIWMILFFFLPILNIIGAILVCLGVAERFGKSAGFGIGLAFLGFIFFPMLAFSDAKWTPGPAA
jgi:hypothetical protein